MIRHGLKYLQGKIVIVVLAEIQSFCLAGDPLAGIVFEFSTIFGFGNHTTLDTQDHIFVHPGAIGAVFAGSGHFLSEEHDIDLTDVMMLLYTNCRRNATVFSDFRQRY